MAAINRNWQGFGRELFTDTGQYALKFEAVESDEAALKAAAGENSTALVPIHKGLTVDQRAVLLAAGEPRFQPRLMWLTNGSYDGRHRLLQPALWHWRVRLYPFQRPISRKPQRSWHDADDVADDGRRR